MSEQVAKRRPVGICEDGVPYEFSDEEIEEYDFEYLGHSCYIAAISNSTKSRRLTTCG